MKDVKIKQRAVAEMESQLVRHVRLSQSVSRVELARQLHLAPSTVGLYVDRLIKDGILVEEKKPSSGSGRPPTILELSPSAGEFIGIDFEASQIAATLVNFSQRVIEQKTTQIAATDSVPDVVGKIETTIASLAENRRLLGIGVGVPGVVDRDRGLALHYEHIPGWDNVPLVDSLADRFQVPVYLENNIRAMALAEQWFGLAKGIHNFVCIGIRSGIGAGVVVNDQLHSGHDGLAGEIGSWPVQSPDASGKGHGRATTLETIASVQAILNELNETPEHQRVTLDEMMLRAQQQDPLVGDALKRAAGSVGKVIAQMSVLLNPELIILAGPLAQLTEAFVDPLRAAVDCLSPLLHTKVPRIEASQFGKFGGTLGAAALAVHQWKPSR